MGNSKLTMGVNMSLNSCLCLTRIVKGFHRLMFLVEDGANFKLVSHIEDWKKILTLIYAKSDANITV